MFTREQPKLTRAQAKKHLKKYGWSYRTAAPACKVTYQHLSCVLNGQRDSLALLIRIEKLPAKADYDLAEQSKLPERIGLLA